MSAITTSATPDAAATQVRLEPLTLDRLDAVLDVEQRAYAPYGHCWTRGNFTDAMGSGNQIQLLLADEQLLGYFVAMPGVEEAHLLNLTVAPAFQRQGWAHVLLDALALWARGQGAQWLWLELRVSNLRPGAGRRGFRTIPGPLSRPACHGVAQPGRRTVQHGAHGAAGGSRACPRCPAPVATRCRQRPGRSGRRSRGTATLASSCARCGHLRLQTLRQQWAPTRWPPQWPPCNRASCW